jgi:hypothetical protein
MKDWALPPEFSCVARPLPRAPLTEGPVSSSDGGRDWRKAVERTLDWVDIT